MNELCEMGNNCTEAKRVRVKWGQREGDGQKRRGEKSKEGIKERKEATKKGRKERSASVRWRKEKECRQKEGDSINERH